MFHAKTLRYRVIPYNAKKMTFPDSTLCPLCKIFVNFVLKKTVF